MTSYIREKKIPVKDKVYVYKYRITEENLGLIRIEEPIIKKHSKI